MWLQKKNVSDINLLYPPLKNDNQNLVYKPRTNAHLWPY